MPRLLVIVMIGAAALPLLAQSRPAATSMPATRPAAAAHQNLTMRASLEMVNIKTALDAFMIHNGRYPTMAEGLDALIHCPSELKKTWKGPYLDAPPVDPWGHPYVYVFPSAKDKLIFELSCAGPDGVPGTGDDIVAP